MSNSYLLNLMIVFFVFMSWCKAGLDEGIGRYILLAIGSWIVIQSLIKFRELRSSFTNVFLYFLIFLIYFGLSYLNPAYRSLESFDLNNVNFNQRIQTAKNKVNANFISQRISVILQTNKNNKNQGLALFNDLKLSYRNRYFSSEHDDLWILINDLDKNIKNKKFLSLPSVAIKDKNLLWNFTFMAFSLYFFILLTNRLGHGCVRKFCYIILINSFILSLVGIHQKINYEFGSNVKEIIGLWDAPEPRYYFSTFTYKNHWSAYALLSIFIGFSLIVKPIQNFGTIFYRSNELILILLLLMPIILSVPFSGSRSGSILLVLSFFSLLFVFTQNFIRKKLKAIILSFSILTSLCILFILLLFFDKNKTSHEMVTNTQTQLNEFVEGKMPLRYYLWSDAIKTGFHSPFFGWGYNSYSAINPIFQSSHVQSERYKLLSNAHNPYIPLIAHAHNDLLEWWCEWGTFGVVLFFIPLLVLLIAQILSCYCLENKILLLSVLLIILYSFIDFPSRNPACFTLAMICFGLGINRPNNK